MNTSAAIEGSSSKGHGEGVLWLELLPHENHFYSPPTAMTAYQLLIYIHPLFEALFKTMLCIPFIFAKHCQVIYRFFIRRVLSQTTRTLSKQDYLWCRHAYFNPLLSVFFFIHPPSNENLWQWDFAGKTWQRELWYSSPATPSFLPPDQVWPRQVLFCHGSCHGMELRGVFACKVSRSLKVIPGENPLFTSSLYIVHGVCWSNIAGDITMSM